MPDILPCAGQQNARSWVTRRSKSIWFAGKISQNDHKKIKKVFDAMAESNERSLIDRAKLTQCQPVGEHMELEEELIELADWPGIAPGYECEALYSMVQHRPGNGWMERRYLFWVRIRVEVRSEIKVWCQPK